MPLDPKTLEDKFLAALDAFLPIPEGVPDYTPYGTFYAQCAATSLDIDTTVDIMLDPYRIGQAQFPTNNGSARWFAVMGGPAHGWVWGAVLGTLLNGEPRVTINFYEGAPPPGMKAMSNEMVIAAINDLDNGPYLPTGWFAWQSKYRFEIKQPDGSIGYKEAKGATDTYTDPATGTVYPAVVNPNWTANKTATTNAVASALVQPQNVGADGNVALLLALYGKLAELPAYLGLTPWQVMQKLDPKEFPA